MLGRRAQVASDWPRNQGPQLVSAVNHSLVNRSTTSRYPETLVTVCVVGVFDIEDLEEFIWAFFLP